MVDIADEAQKTTGVVVPEDNTQVMESVLQSSSAAPPPQPPPPPPKKSKKGILMAILLLLVVVIPITASYTSLKTPIASMLGFAKDDDDDKDKKDKKKDKDTSLLINKTQTVTLPKFTTEQCPFGQDDNIASKSGDVNARIQKNVSFTLEPNCTLVNGSITSLRKPPEYLYDDTLHILIDGNLVAGPSTLIPPLELGKPWDWSKIVGEEQDSKESTIVCIGSPCKAPLTHQGNDSDIEPLVNIGLSQSNLTKLLTPNATTHTFSAAVVGDNNQADCKLQEDLVLTLNYSCQQVTPQCQNIKIYKNGVVVTPASLLSGDSVLIAVVGGNATKARVRVNGGAFSESSTTNTSGEFTVPFTVPPNVFTFTIEAEVFNNGTWQ